MTSNVTDWKVLVSNLKLNFPPKNVTLSPGGSHYGHGRRDRSGCRREGRRDDRQDREGAHTHQAERLHHVEGQAG